MSDRNHHLFGAQKMHKALLLLVFSVCGLLVACRNEPGIAEVENAPTKIVAKESSPQDQESDEKEESGAKKLLNMANKFLDEQAESGSDNAKKAQQWMSDKFGDASDSGSEIAEDAAKWASEAFESLKDKGMTSADSASQWLTEDIRNMNALKYKVIKISLDDLDELEDQLNDLGKLRWDCFHAVEKDGHTILFLKKERRSILKNIPVRDMMRLIPLMSEGGE